MNINDVGELQEIPENMLEYIFKTQRTLMEKYEIIEAENGLLQTADIPVDLHSKNGQARLKDMAWRCMEEIAEALEALHSGDEDSLLHAQEEIADALHFFVEFSILADIPLGDIIQVETLDMMAHQQYYVDRGVRPLNEALSQFVMYLGLSCNQLKNKPWKQTQMLTDVAKFKNLVVIAWDAFMFLAGCFHIRTFEELFQLYFRKSEVNKFRQRSNY